MAIKTPKYALRKKEDNDFYDFDDLNANWDEVENALTEFDDSGTAEGVTSFPEMLTKLVTGNKLAVTLKNLKAGLQFVLHAGSIVNNCVTDNANLPLSAAQGKALQDALTVLNNELKETSSNLQHGSVDITLAVNKEEEHEVVFPYKFAKIPTVMVSIERNGYTSSATVMVRKGSVTTSGFKFTSINSESINAEVVVSWFAITK